MTPELAYMLVSNGDIRPSEFTPGVHARCELCGSALLPRGCPSSYVMCHPRGYWCSDLCLEITRGIAQGCDAGGVDLDIAYTL